MLCQLLNKRICYVRTGIALRLSEWETFRKVVIDDVRRNHPVVANFTHTMLPERGPHNSGRHADMSVVQSIHFVVVSDKHYLVVRTRDCQ